MSHLTCHIKKKSYKGVELVSGALEGHLSRPRPTPISFSYFWGVSQPPDPLPPRHQGKVKQLGNVGKVGKVGKVKKEEE